MMQMIYDRYGDAIRAEVISNPSVVASLIPGLSWDDQCPLWQQALQELRDLSLGWPDLEACLLQQGVPFDRTRDFRLCFLGA